MKIGTYVYSSACPEALSDLIDEMCITFGIPRVTINDLFYYGVFCKDVTYANYKYWDDAPSYLEIPEQLVAPCQTPEGRLEYVHRITNELITGVLDKKPEWMEYIEMTESCNEFDAAPSTYLYLVPKENKYKNFTEKILQFLYSPNMIDFSYRY